MRSARILFISCLVLLASCVDYKAAVPLPDAPTVIIPGPTPDTTPPMILSISTPASGLYGDNDQLDFTVTFSEPVTITGSPRIKLTIGSTDVWATASAGALSDTHTFSYVVGTADKDTNGLDAYSPIDLNSGVIQDAAANASDLVFADQATGARINDLTFNGPINKIVPLTDHSGRMYVVGDFTQVSGLNFNRIVRLKSNLTPDPSFDPGTGFNALVLTATIAQDGSNDLYAGGCFTNFNGEVRKGVARVKSDGDAHLGFDPLNGIGNDTTCGSATRVESLIHSNDGTGDLFIVGKFSSYDSVVRNAFARIRPTGRVSPDWNTSNKFYQYNTATGLSLTRDGSNDVMIVGGLTEFNGSNAFKSIFRISKAGNMVGSFGTKASSTMHKVINSALDDESFYIVKQGGTYDGNGSRVLRIKPDATVDSGFNPGNDFSSDALNIITSVFANRNLYMGGVFNGYNSNPASYLVKTQSNGTYISGGSSAIFNNEVSTISQDRVGRGLVYVGGRFTDYFVRMDELQLSGASAPYVKEITSTTASSTVSTAGEAIVFDVKFSEAVTVASGAPYLKLNTSVPGTSRKATYTSGAGTDTLRFTYTTASGHTTNGLNLSYIDENSMFDAGGIESVANAGRKASIIMPLPYDQGSFTFNRSIQIAVP